MAGWLAALASLTGALLFLASPVAAQPVTGHASNDDFLTPESSSSGPSPKAASAIAAKPATSSCLSGSSFRSRRASFPSGPHGSTG